MIGFRGLQITSKLTQSNLNFQENFLEKKKPVCNTRRKQRSDMECSVTKSIGDGETGKGAGGLEMRRNAKPNRFPVLSQGRNYGVLTAQEKAQNFKSYAVSLSHITDNKLKYTGQTKYYFIKPRCPKGVGTDPSVFPLITIERL